MIGGVNLLFTILLFCVGLVLIIKGGDYFIESAVRIARASHLPEIFIGATIVSIATTLPEGVVSITASVKGYTTMSIGNAIGSTICNTGLILGLMSLIKPSKIKGKFFKLKAIIMLLYFVAIIVLAYDGLISTTDSVLLLMLLFFYIIIDTFILKYKQNQNMQHNKIITSMKEKIKVILFFIIGILGIVIGSNLLINNGISIAQFIGVPESVISLSFIALGTSLPELTTAITALKKGHTSLSVGNIIGANILNITMVIGASGIINPLEITRQNIVLDFPTAFLMTAILTLPSIFRSKITKFQGFILLIIYISYILILYNIYI